MVNSTKEIIAILYKCFKKEEGILSNSFYEALKPKADKNHTKKNYRPISFMYRNTKTLNKISTNGTVHKKR